MPETLDAFLPEIDAAFEAVEEDLCTDDDAATSLLEYLAFAKEPPGAPLGRRSGRLVSLMADRGRR